MRAIFYSDLQDFSSNLDKLIFDKDSEQYHHLVHVARCKKGEEVLILDGNGAECTAVIEEISKKLISFIQPIFVIKKVLIENHFNQKISLILRAPKREALEVILRSSVEIGLQHVTLIKSSSYLQRPLSEQRCRAILENALIQSNNRYLPTIEWINESEVEDRLKDQAEGPIIWFTTNKAMLEKFENAKNSQGLPQLLIEDVKKQQISFIIGNEFGLFDYEEKVLESSNLYQNIYPYLSDGPILRSETAVIYFYGFLQALNLRRPIG